MKRKIKFISFLIIFAFVLLCYNKVVNAAYKIGDTHKGNIESSVGTTLYVGQTAKLTFNGAGRTKIFPSQKGASYANTYQPSTWKTSNKKIVSVKADKVDYAIQKQYGGYYYTENAKAVDNKATITAKEVGTAKITFNCTFWNESKGYQGNNKYISYSHNIVEITITVKNLEKEKNEKKEEATENGYGSYIKDNDAKKLRVETNANSHKFSGSTKKAMVTNFIKSYGITISNSKSNQIKFANDSKVEGVQKLTGLSFVFTPKSKTVVYRTYKGGVNSDGSSAMNWEEYTLKKNKKYYVTFNFVYLKNSGTIKYQAYWKPYEYKEAAKEQAEESSEQASTRTENRVEEVEKVYKQIKSMIDLANKQEDRETVSFTDALTDTDYYSKPGDISSSDAKKVTNKLSTILSVITTIGIVASVIILAAIGIKYILGSVEERAEYKKDMIPYVIGLTLLLSVTTVVKIIQTLGNNINKI